VGWVADSTAEVRKTEWGFQLEVLAREAKCLINVAAVLAGMLQLSNNCFLVLD
jgi:hypothetical protein